MGRLNNSAEGGSNGVVVTAGSSGGASGEAWQTVNDGTANNTVQFSTAATLFGSMGYLFQTGGTADVGFITWANTMTPALTYYSRVYCQFVGTLPASVYRIFQLTNNSFASSGGVGISGSGKFAVRNSAGTLIQSSTTNVPTDAWCRLELKVFSSATVGQIELKIYLDPYSDTPTETVTTAANVNTLGGNIQGVAFGPDVAVANFTMYMDEISVSDLGYIGAAAYRSPWMSA